MVLAFIGAIVGGVISLLIIGLIFMLIGDGGTPTSKKRQEKVAGICWLLLLTASAVTEPAMHFRMKHRLEPLAERFAATAALGEEGTDPDDPDPLHTIVAERERQLDQHGYVSFGKWWSTWDGDGDASVDTDRILYIWIPLL